MDKLETFVINPNFGEAGWYTEEEIRKKLPEKICQFRQLKLLYLETNHFFPLAIQDYWDSKHYDLAIDLTKELIINQKKIT